MSLAQTAGDGVTVVKACNHAELTARWQSLMGRPPPKAASRIFMMRALTYEFQAQRRPDLSQAHKKVLTQAVQQACPTPGSMRSPPVKPRVALVPGSRLVREWNGKTYTVCVVQEGFVYRDKVWGSLSAIVKDITGAHWSGPRFFGLHKAKS